MPQTLLEWYPNGSPSTSHIMSILIVQLKQDTMYSHDYLVAINHVMQMQPFAKAFCYVTTVSDIASTNQPSLFGGAPLGNLGLKRKSYRWSASELSCYLVHGTIKPDSEYRFHKLIVQNKDTLADQAISVNLPLKHLVPRLQKIDLGHIAVIHQLNLGSFSKLTKAVISDHIIKHKCIHCPKLIASFVPLDPIQSLTQHQKCFKAKQLQSMHADAASLNMASPFPPQPPSSVLLNN